MITNITPEALKEKSFQTLIKSYLIEQNGYVESFNSGYDKEDALDLECLFNFLERTQAKEMQKLQEIYKYNYKGKIVNNLTKELKARGSLDLLKHGFKDYGVKLELAYFKPPTDLNPEQMRLYQENILSVTEELNHIDGKRIDLVIFLNGIPVITMELKNAFTGQTYKDAIKQYKNNRQANEPLFRFTERALVNFALDTDEIYMTTRLNGDNTVFLPFNKGNNGGAGNPSVEGKLKTYYFWEEVLTKDSILEIIHKFIYLEEKEEITNEGKKTTKKTVIFPRYHQLDVVREILSHAKDNGAGFKYLVQHSAGSGKTNSITWLTHRLAALHDDNNNLIFDGVIVVTDRVVLNDQLQDAIYQLEHKLGLVAKIKEGSNELAQEMEKGTKIIITTIQTFPFVLDKIAGTKGNNYALVIDEAHSSTSGKNIMALKESLTLEEAAELAQQEEEETIDVEDKINQELEKFTEWTQVSIFAFTATPKGSTLRLFGSQGTDGKYYPFHIYSMRQAIEEEFILDVLQNYLTYKMYYKVNKQIEDDPAFEKSKATKSIARFVSLHPHNIAQKTEIIIEHFRNSTKAKIGGTAKAMLVTSSRLHAVKYKLAFDKYIKTHGYTDLKTLVAFSGKVKDAGEEYKETAMNKGISEKQLPKTFDKNEYQLLIVADKYQTGFDQPKLHTMYVDKKLSGVRAVQTLSRLNRIHSGKEDTFVLDFVNEPEEIKAAFLPFYEVTTLGNDIEPNEIYSLEREIYDKRVINKEDVLEFTDLFYKKKPTNKDVSAMNQYVDNSVSRMEGFSREETIGFRNLLRKFINLYMLIIQIAPIVDADLHRLSIYLRYLIAKIEVTNTGGVDITDKVLLEFYKLEKQGQSTIKLNESAEVFVRVSGGGQGQEEEKDLLSNIIEKLNEKYGTEFAESEKLALEQITTNLKKSKELEIKAKANNTIDEFRYALEDKFSDSAVIEYEKNQDFYGRILQDENYRGYLIDLVISDIYNHFNGGGPNV